MDGNDGPQEEQKLSMSQKKRNKKNKKKQDTKQEEKQEECKPQKGDREWVPEKKHNGCDETIDAMWESDDDGFDIDAVIEKLLSVSKKNPGTLVNLEIDTIMKIIEKAKRIIEKQPMFLRLKAPLTVGTDIHG